MFLVKRIIVNAILDAIDVPRLSIEQEKKDKEYLHRALENGLKERSGERKESNLTVRHVAAADSTDDGFINVTSETPSDNPIR